MSIILHDLAFKDDVRPSPYCWRVRLALEHKGLPYRTVPVGFTGISAVAGGGQRTVPVAEIPQTTGPAKVVGDSWAIANALEETYPDRPSLFGEGPGREMGWSYALHCQGWLATSVLMPALKVILFDLFQRIQPSDQAYFRASREKRFGMTLEAFAASDTEAQIKVARTALEPARSVVKEKPFLCGGAPYHADYMVAGFLFWWRAVSPTQLLTPDDPLSAWFARLLERYPRIAQESTRCWQGP